MRQKDAVLSTMQREDLKAVIQDYEIDGVDLRSREDMADTLRSAKRVRVGALLEYLSEQQIKEVCELCGVSSTGRRRALIERLIEARQDGQAAKPNPPGEEAATIGGDGAAPPASNDEPPTEWMESQPEAIVSGLTITKPELIWPGKYDEHGNRVINRGVALPFQVVETIEEGRATREPGHVSDLFSARPSSDRQWRNKLIWGDNLLVMASLLEELAGKVNLIYIDPPFNAGRNFKHSLFLDTDITVESVKTESLIQTKAYYDTWGNGLQSYLQMIYDRLVLARDLLSERGAIYVHIGPGVSHYVQSLLDEIFGTENGMEIIWKRTTAHADSRIYGTVHDAIFFYWKSDQHTWNPQFVAHDEKYLQSKYCYTDADGRRFRLDNITSPNPRPNMTYEWKGHAPPSMGWRYSRERMAELDAQGRIWYPDSKEKRPQLKRYLDESEGVPLSALWTDINPVNSQANEDTGYDTQKPEALLQRILKASSNEGDLVMDFFCGSGTTPAVAEELGRRWIACDLGRFAIHTTRKRLLDVPDCKPFEILNLGQYERKYWQGMTFGEEKPATPDQAAVAAYVKFILDLYHAQPLAGTHVHGRKASALVHVGAVDAPVTISEINAALAEAAQLGQKELHVLGWEWEMGLHDPLVQQAKQSHGMRLRLLYIPREVMERQAVDRGDVRFFDLAHLEAEVVPIKGSKRKVKVRLADFVIPDTDLIPEEVRSKIKKWSDYIDYWAVDWDFQHDTFMNQWQAYRTRKERKLDLQSAEHEFEKPGKYRILVKVVDIFGNDTSRLLSWEAK